MYDFYAVGGMELMEREGFPLCVGRGRKMKAMGTVFLNRRGGVKLIDDLAVDGNARHRLDLLCKIYTDDVSIL